jgi:hypothetical protein
MSIDRSSLCSLFNQGAGNSWTAAGLNSLAAEAVLKSFGSLSCAKQRDSYDGCDIRFFVRLGME